MECECEGEKVTVKAHDVIRRGNIVGNYNLCGKCNRVEWNWIEDELEVEIKDSLYHYFVKPIVMAKEPYLT